MTTKIFVRNTCRLCGGPEHDLALRLVPTPIGDHFVKQEYLGNPQESFPLELFLCRRNTKEHESVVSADIDARQVHLALIAAGAKEGSPVKFEPKYQPATGSTIKITVEYEQDGKTVSVPAQQWVRDSKTRKELPHPWVFGGSQLFDHPDDPKQKVYAANAGGDVICVSNFPDAMLDLPVNSPNDDADRQYEAFTEHIPPLGTKVTVILEPMPYKK